MSDIAIRIEGLGKQYSIGRPERYQTFRDTLTDAVSAPFKRAYGLMHGHASAASNLSETFWALNDVSFDVKRGEVVGIIGRNGAGKSTLLKILSRITGPTTGFADVYGRVGALLEVGTGFHPELTGRENIYLSGAILGMSRVEIERKFDEIVAFADVEKFIDTPVKHFSSGMGLRLGFAVAAHLEPEILIIDEVLAVGDAAFQKKCLGKMNEVASEGRTALFVSHNMSAVESLCGRSVVLSQGQVVYEGKTDDAISFYLENADELNPVIDLQRNRSFENTQMTYLKSLRVMDEAGQLTTAFPIGADIVLEVEVFSPGGLREPHVVIGVTGSRGVTAFTVSTRMQQVHLPSITGRGTVRCYLSNVALAPDVYSLKVKVGDPYDNTDIADGVLAFRIVDSDFYGSGRLPHISEGIILRSAEWQSADEAPLTQAAQFSVQN